MRHNTRICNILRNYLNTRASNTNLNACLFQILNLLICRNKYSSLLPNQSVYLKHSLWFNFGPIGDKKFQNEFDFIIGGKHESLCFTYDVIKNMYRYIINNIDTMNEIYNTNAFVEEIIPQTLGYHLRSNKDDISFTFIKETRLLQRKVDVINRHNSKQFRENV